MYYAGETITGKVIASLMSPRQAQQVVVKVSGKETVEWDDERTETVFEGEGEQRKSRTVHHHHERRAKHKLFKDLIIVSAVNHILPPGVWEYPFSYTLRRDAPGCVKYHSSTQSADPHWRQQGRQNHVKVLARARGVCCDRATRVPCSHTALAPTPVTPRQSDEGPLRRASPPPCCPHTALVPTPPTPSPPHLQAKIVYSFKAAMQNGQVFSRDIKGSQEVVVNSFFDWSKMHPAHAERAGNVWLCCCIPRGKVTVSADFDKSAYAGGETALIKAVIDNESKRCGAGRVGGRAGACVCARVCACVRA